MIAFEIIAIVALVLAVGTAGYAAGISAKVKILEHENDKLNDYVAKLARESAEFRGWCQDMQKKVENMQKKVEELPVEEMNEEVKRMNAWNFGVQEIMNFGPDVPRLKKEGLKHE